MIQYHKIDPVIFSVGPLSVHWYGLMYVIGFFAGWWLGRYRARKTLLRDREAPWKPIDVDDLVFFSALGTVLGGRLGWILFYGLEDVIAEPMRALRVWEGGMSFHGGIIGGLLALYIFARRRQRHILDVWDFAAPLPAIGLCAGRIGNFINGELWGKPTDVSWAFIVDGVPRHPSQLYEAFLEGIVLFVIVWIYTAKPRPRGAPTGLFLMLYGVFRSVVEFVRVPDDNRGYLLLGWVTEGQLLSLPMIIVGGWLMIWAYRQRLPQGSVKSTSV
ncbi:MAG: prolipoprotein diacylglyceryl transferase [Candidatus Obscuribacterales bacterium]|nr:prolipoprotein diacylglyceryl transferase [Steroidobacteraceae bacterium]